MKIAVFALFTSLFSFSAIAAKSEFVAVCENDQTKLILRKVSATEYKATVKTEVAGGATPKFTFKGIQKYLPKAPRPGAPIVYGSDEITVYLQRTVLKPYANLSVRSLGIDDEKLDCER